MKECKTTIISPETPPPAMPTGLKVLYTFDAFGHGDGEKLTETDLQQLIHSIQQADKVSVFLSPHDDVETAIEEEFFRLRLTTAGLLYSMSWETLLQTAISARALTRIILIPMRSPRWCRATASLSFSRNTPCMTPSLPPNALNTSRAPESSTRAWLGFGKKHYNMQKRVCTQCSAT